MPQFTPWNVPSPAPNVLYNPAAVDQSIADTQSKLGQLDINRQTLGLEQRKLDLQQAGGKSILDSLTGGGGTAAPADVTPFEQQMGSAEGGSDPTAVNKQGYAGQFQFGAGRLADLGLYTPAPGEDLKSNQWKGQFHIAPYNVSTLQDFLNNPAAQHAAFTAHVANIDNAINNTPGADKFDRNGLRAVAHLGGVGGMQAFIQSGGNLNSADSNGTTLQQYYRKFAAGGPALLQKSFGSVHGPGGPPSNLPAVQPGGNVSTAWVDPNAPVVPTATAPPPFNPNAGPRVAGASPASPPLPGYPPQVSDANGIAVPTPVRMPDPGAAPVQTSAADASVPVAPSPIALRTGGTDVAGPGAGPDALPAVPAPNRMYQTGLPGITIGANPLAPSATTGAPPGTATAAAAPAPGTAPPAGTAPPGGAARPTVLTPPPALPRAIPPPQVLPSGLTAADTRIVAGMVQSGTPTATVATFIESAKQRNTALQQQYLTNQAAVDQANYQRQRDAQADAIARQTAARQGMPEGYVPDANGNPVRMPGLPPPAVPANYMWDDKKDSFIDTTGQHPPVTPRPGPITVLPDGSVAQPKPGGGMTILQPADPAAIALRKAAEAQGTETGQNAAKLVTVLAAQGQNANNAINNIDDGVNQIAQAAAGNLHTGYFAPWIGTIAAAAKSLGGDDLARLATGVDPGAVGNLQSAEKMLGIVSGKILDQVLGKGQMTDAKIEHFIHTQPGISTDPQALARVLNWARTQFVYEHEMSKAAMADVSPGGTLPLNWQAKYYQQHGFGPLYNPRTGEMGQPDGQSPPREPPAPVPPVWSPTTSSVPRVAGTTYTTPKGPLKWTGTGWVSP